MKNKEKYYDEICESLAWNIACDFKHKYILDRICCTKKDNCFNGDCSGCYTEFKKWLEEECVKLTHEEYIILKNMNNVKWIVRDSNGMLYIYEKQPYKSYDMEWSNDGVELSHYNHLFQFIKWDNAEPYRVSDLLLEYDIYYDIKPASFTDDEWEQVKANKQKED